MKHEKASLFTPLSKNSAQKGRNSLVTEIQYNKVSIIKKMDGHD